MGFSGCHPSNYQTAPDLLSFSMVIPSTVLEMSTRKHLIVLYSMGITPHQDCIQNHVSFDYAGKRRSLLQQFVSGKKKQHTKKLRNKSVIKLSIRENYIFQQFWILGSGEDDKVMKKSCQLHNFFLCPHVQVDQVY